MIFPRPREVLSPRASTQRRDMTTRPSTVTELAAVTFTDAQRKESPTPMSAQRAYSRAADSKKKIEDQTDRAEKREPLFFFRVHKSL